MRKIILPIFFDLIATEADGVNILEGQTSYGSGKEGIKRILEFQGGRLDIKDSKGHFDDLQDAIIGGIIPPEARKSADYTIDHECQSFPVLKEVLENKARAHKFFSTLMKDAYPKSMLAEPHVLWMPEIRDNFDEGEMLAVKLSKSFLGQGVTIIPTHDLQGLISLLDTIRPHVLTTLSGKDPRDISRFPKQVFDRNILPALENIPFGDGKALDKYNEFLEKGYIHPAFVTTWMVNRELLTIQKYIAPPIVSAKKMSELAGMEGFSEDDTPRQGIIRYACCVEFDKRGGVLVPVRIHRGMGNFKLSGGDVSGREIISGSKSVAPVPKEVLRAIDAQLQPALANMVAFAAGCEAKGLEINQAITALENITPQTIAPLNVPQYG